MFVHVVNFFLKADISAEDRLKFEQGVSSLGQVEGLELFNVGKPASTDRPVIDRSYDYCLLTVFKDMAGHDVYQVDPIHLKFVEDCKQYWDRVVIYDSETI
ncbi:transcription-repair coupling factor [Siphonobacter sp. BAB-5385]|uniref:Dabb family protein n=1 Tax=Siphonobacter curvatus TaxID=2094562 RepID=A0A2S7IQM4_9BACT|nr:MULTISPECIES: Dabb family protein [Siphonobacter]OZI09410.1 transcription-repair coupling factor [Siphonobacter sp. BAB-5385]PQA59966.1 Dabb family protein [Siphonobacter curvatus]